MKLSAKLKTWVKMSVASKKWIASGFLGSAEHVASANSAKRETRIYATRQSLLAITGMAAMQNIRPAAQVTQSISHLSCLTPKSLLSSAQASSDFAPIEKQILKKQLGFMDSGHRPISSPKSPIMKKRESTHLPEKAIPTARSLQKV